MIYGSDIKHIPVKTYPALANEHLLPCPFCGCKEIELQIDGCYMSLSCKSCEAKTGTIYADIYVFDRLVNAWNKRAI